MFSRFGTIRRVIDWQTVGRTHDDSIYRACIASRGNHNLYIPDIFWAPIPHPFADHGEIGPARLHVYGVIFPVQFPRYPCEVILPVLQRNAASLYSLRFLEDEVRLTDMTWASETCHETFYVMRSLAKYRAARDCSAITDHFSRTLRGALCDIFRELFSRSRPATIRPTRMNTTCHALISTCYVCSHKYLPSTHMAVGL